MSKYGFVKISTISPKTVVADAMSNANNAYISILDAACVNSQIAVLPELCLSGYTCGDLFLQSKLTDSCQDALLWLLEKTASLDLVFVVGLPVKIGFRLFDCAAVCQKGKILGVVPKTYISHHNGTTEKRWFTSGNQIKESSVILCGENVAFGKLLFKIGEDITLGVEIGEDILSPVSPSSIMALRGANVIVNLSASSETVTLNEKRKEIIKAQSLKNLCAYAFASAGCGESSTDDVYSGACLIAECGQILNQNEIFSFENSIISACVDIQKIENYRLTNSTFKDAANCFSSDEYKIITAGVDNLPDNQIDRIYSKTPFIPENEEEKIKRCKEALDIQSMGLIKRLIHTGINKVVVGISGGLDSTLALLVCNNVFKKLDFNKEDIICVTMPGFGTTTNTKNNSIDLIHSLGATLKIVDIKNACIQHFEDIGHDKENLDITYENTQARERTQILMDIANKQSALLVGTGDLSEAALGWCTYNGDHMSMYNVNCDIPKTFVRHLVKYVTSLSDKKTASILQSIVDTPISPELLPPDKCGNMTQKTEDNIGPYELHDFFLYHFIRNNFSPEKIYFIATKTFDKTYDDKTILKWLKVFIKRFFISQFKRSCEPDGPKVGTVDLSPRGNWEMPSDAEFDRWYDGIE